MKYLALLLLAGCTTLNWERGEVCLKSKQLQYTVPLDSLPYKHECKSKEVFNKVLNHLRR